MPIPTLSTVLSMQPETHSIYKFCLSLLTLHQLCISLSEGDYESDSYSVVFQPGDTSAELRIPILDDSLGVEGTENFTAILSVFSNVSVTPGSLSMATIFISDDEETFVEFTPVSYVVNERERMVVLNITASGVGALGYSVGVDVLPGTAQGRCIVCADCVVVHF